MQNPYEVLGVSKTASAKDIKAAYRKLAKKHHPDQNPTDPKAKDRFAALNQAYEIVGDDKNRTAFDRGEIDASGKQRFQHRVARDGRGRAVSGRGIRPTSFRHLPRGRSVKHGGAQRVKLCRRHRVLHRCDGKHDADHRSGEKQRASFLR